MKKILYLLFALISVVEFSSSCKKDDSTTTSNYMTGTVDFDLPKYVVPGQVLELEASGILYPTDISWLWYSRSMHISETDSVVGKYLTVTIPDTLGTDTLTCYAKNSAYYTSSKTKYTEVFDPEIGGWSVEGIMEGDSTITDSRDGEEYFVKKYGHLWWFTMNLRYDGCGVSYQFSDSTAKLFGRLYSWIDATDGKGGEGLGGGPRGACPEGWSVPTEEDWTDFANAVKPASVKDSLIFADNWDGLAPDVSADIRINGNRMWEYSPDNVQNNKWAWNAIPTGKSSNSYKTFEQMLNYGFWWSSCLEDGGGADTLAYFRYIFWNYPNMPLGSADRKSIGFSVRCVKLI